MKKDRFQNWKVFGIETLGSLLVAMSIYNFAAAAEFPMTGFTGISLILYRLFEIPLGLSNILLNVPVILITFRILGREFFLRSVRCMLVSSIFIDYILPAFPIFTGDRLLAAICTGGLGGIGYALIYMQNSSTGGADFIIMLIKSRTPHLALGNITFLFAAVIILLTWLLFGDTEGVIYGFIINYLSGFMINKIMYGRNTGKLTMIITEDGKRLAQRIEDYCHRGSTILEVQGGHKQKRRQAVLCACSNKQMFEIQRMVQSLEPEAFMMIWESNEVHENSFRMFSTEAGQKSEK